MHLDHRRHAVYFWSIVASSDLPRPTTDELFGTSVSVPAKGPPFKECVIRAFCGRNGSGERGSECGRNARRRAFSDGDDDDEFNGRSGRPDDERKRAEERYVRRENRRETIAINWHSMDTQWWCACSPQTARPASYATVFGDRRSRDRRRRGARSFVRERRRDYYLDGVRETLVAPSFLGTTRSTERTTSGESRSR